MILADKEYHGIEIEGRLIPQHVVDWLNERVGDGHWFLKGTIGGQTIYFDNEKSHLLFLMTWGK